MLSELSFARNTLENWLQLVRLGPAPLRHALDIFHSVGIALRVSLVVKLRVLERDHLRALWRVVGAGEGLVERKSLLAVALLVLDKHLGVLVRPRPGGGAWAV